MLPATLNTIEAVLAGDQSINTTERKAHMQILRKGLSSADERIKDRVISRKEVAEKFGVTTKTIDNWKNKGIITPVKLAKFNKAIGYRESDIDALIAGPSHVDTVTTQSPEGHSAPSGTCSNGEIDSPADNTGGNNEQR